MQILLTEYEVRGFFNDYNKSVKDIEINVKSKFKKNRTSSVIIKTRFV